MRSAAAALTLFGIFLHSSVQAVLFDCSTRIENLSAVLKDPGMFWKLYADAAGKRTTIYTVKIQSKTTGKELDLTLSFGTENFISRLLCASRITALYAQDTKNENSHENERFFSPCSKIEVKRVDVTFNTEIIQMDFMASTFRVLKWQRDNEMFVSVRFLCQKHASRRHLRVFALETCGYPEEHHRSVSKKVNVIPCGETSFLKFHKNNHEYTYVYFEVIDCTTGQLLKAENSVHVRIEEEKITSITEHSSECMPEKTKQYQSDGTFPSNEQITDIGQSSESKLGEVLGSDALSADGSSVSVNVDGGTMSRSQDDHSSLENSANASGNTVNIKINIPPIITADNSAVNEHRVSGQESTSLESDNNVSRNTGRINEKAIEAIRVLPNGLPVKANISSIAATLFRILPEDIFTSPLQIEAQAKLTHLMTGQVITVAGIRLLNFSENNATVILCPNETKYGVNITLISFAHNPVEVNLRAQSIGVQELVDSVQLESRDAPHVVAVPLTGWPEDGAVLRADMRGPNCIRLQIYRTFCQALRSTSDFIYSHIISGDRSLALDSKHFSRGVAFLRYRRWRASGSECSGSSPGVIGHLSMIEGSVTFLRLFLPPAVSLIISLIGLACGRRWVKAVASGCGQTVSIQGLPASPVLPLTSRLSLQQPNAQQDLAIAAPSPLAVVSMADETISMRDSGRTNQEDDSTPGDLTSHIPQTSVIHTHQVTSCSVEQRTISSIFIRPSWTLTSLTCLIPLLSFSQQLSQANGCQISAVLLLTHSRYGFMGTAYCSLVVLPMMASLVYLRSRLFKLPSALVREVVRVWPGQGTEWLLLGFFFDSVANSTCPGTRTLLPSNIFIAIFFWAATGINGGPPTSSRLHQAAGIAASLALPSWFSYPWNVVLKTLSVPVQMLVAVYCVHIALSSVRWRHVRLWLVLAAAVNGGIAAVSWPFSSDVHLLLTVIFNKMLISQACRRCGTSDDNTLAYRFFGKSQLLSAASVDEATPPAFFWRRRLQLVALVSLVSAVTLHEFPSIVQDLMVDPPQLVCVLYSLAVYLVHICN